MYPYFESHSDSNQRPRPSKELISWFNYFKSCKIPCVIIKTIGAFRDYGQHQLWREGKEYVALKSNSPNNTFLPSGERVMSYRWEH
jgi:hypothetical protein